VSKLSDLRIHLRAFLLRFGAGFTECPDLDLAFEEWYKTLSPSMLPPYEDLARAYARDFYNVEWQGPAIRRSDIRPANRRIGLPPVRPEQLLLLPLKGIRLWCVDYARVQVQPSIEKLHQVCMAWDEANPGEMGDVDRFVRSVLQTARKQA
jgi:hypothetical protein